MIEFWENKAWTRSATQQEKYEESKSKHRRILKWKSVVDSPRTTSLPEIFSEGLVTQVAVKWERHRRDTGNNQEGTKNLIFWQ